MARAYSQRPFVFINQSAGDLCADIVNVFAESGVPCVLIAGTRRACGLERLRADVALDEMMPYDKSRTWKRLWTWIWGTFQIWRKIFFKYRDCDLFIVTNPPFATLVPLLCKNRFWVLVYDIYPEVLIHAGLIKDGGIPARLWRAAHRRVYGRAQCVFTLGKGMADCLSHYMDAKKIEVVDNWADTSFLKPISPGENLFKRAHNLEGKFVVMYSGNIGNTHCVEVLVEVADALRNERDVVFVIIGEGGKKALIERMVRERSLENCLLLPYQPKSMLPHSLGTADIGVITLEPGAAQLSVPSKTYSLLASGSVLMCIAGENCELDRLVKRHGVGERFDSGDIAGMSAFVMHLKDNPDELLRLRQCSRAAAAYFTPENARLYFDRVTKSLDSKN